MSNVRFNDSTVVQAASQAAEQAAPVLPAYYFERSALDRLAAGAAAESFAPVVDATTGRPIAALPLGDDGAVRWP